MKPVHAMLYVQNSDEISQVVMEKIDNLFSFSHIIYLERGLGISFKQKRIFLTQETFVLSLKMLKVYRWTDNEQQTIDYQNVHRSM